MNQSIGVKPVQFQQRFHDQKYQTSQQKIGVLFHHAQRIVFLGIR